MGTSIGDLLRDKKPSEPEEFSVIRQFISERFSANCQLQIQNGAIIITVANSALAGSLQFELHELEEKTGKKLRIRIG